MIRLLVEHGADLEATSDGNRSALMLTLLPSYLAGAKSTAEALEDSNLLLSLGADPNHCDGDGNSALHVACGCYELLHPSSTHRSPGMPIRVKDSEFQVSASQCRCSASQCRIRLLAADMSAQVGLRQGWGAPSSPSKSASCSANSPHGIAGMSNASPRYRVTGGQLQLLDWWSPCSWEG